MGIEHERERTVDLKKINQFKNILYEGEVIRCKKPVSYTDYRTEFRDCTARIIKKNEHTVTLEDLDPRIKTRKIFTRTYFDLMGGYFNG